MAAKNATETANFPSITVLDSEDEEEQSTDELFKGFLKVVKPFLERKELLLLRVKFQAIGPDFKCSSRFKDMLRRKTNQVHKVDVYIHFKEVLNAVILNAAVYDGKGLKTSQESELSSENGSSEFEGDMGQKKKQESRQSPDNDALAGNFENSEEDRPRKKTAINLPNQSIDNDVQIIENINSLSQPGSSAVGVQDSKNSGSKEKNAAKEEMKIKRRKLIEKLEAKLKYTSEEVKRLSQAELSLEEMEYGDSSYIMESRLKNRFNNIWNKICKLKGRPTNTGRVTEGAIKYKKTGFPAIDKAVGKFLKKLKGFPDIFDIRNIIMKVNKRRALGLAQGVQSDIAADILTDIGNKLQKKRKKDFDFNFGCHLTDDCLPSLDPALNNTSLRQKLEENKKINQNALDKIFDKYVHLDRVKDMNHCNNSNIPSESDLESEDEPQHCKKRKHKSSSENDSDNKNSKKKSKRVKISTNNHKEKISVGNAEGAASTSAATVVTPITDESDSLEIDNSKSTKEDNSTNNNEGNHLADVCEISGPTAVSTPGMVKSGSPVVESAQVVDEKVKTVKGNVPCTVNPNGLKSLELQTNYLPSLQPTTSNPEVKAVQKHSNGFNDNDVVEIIDNDPESVENHGAIVEGSGKSVQECEESIQKRKPALSSTKLLDKIKELRNNQLSEFMLNRSSTNSSASRNQEQADYCHSKRKATNVRHLTPNQQHLDGSSTNGLVNQKVPNHTHGLEQINGKGKKIVSNVPVTSSSDSQHKETTGFKESLKNCPSTLKNKSLLQNNIHNITPQKRLNGTSERHLLSPGQKGRISETTSSKCSPKGKSNIQKQMGTVIILSDDDDD